MTKKITIEDDLYVKILELKTEGESFQDVLKIMYEKTVLEMNTRLFVNIKGTKNIREIMKERGLL